MFFCLKQMTIILRTALGKCFNKPPIMPCRVIWTRSKTHTIIFQYSFKQNILSDDLKVPVEIKSNTHDFFFFFITVKRSIWHLTNFHPLHWWHLHLLIYFFMCLHVSPTIYYSAMLSILFTLFCSSFGTIWRLIRPVFGFRRLTTFCFKVDARSV